MENLRACIFSRCRLYYRKLHGDLIIERNWISLTTTSACVRAVDDLDLLGVMPTTSPLMMLSTTAEKRTKLKLTPSFRLFLHTAFLFLSLFPTKGKSISALSARNRRETHAEDRKGTIPSRIYIVKYVEPPVFCKIIDGREISERMFEIFAAAILKSGN